MTKKVYIIFDIGKTNKKYFLFDENLSIVEQYIFKFEEIVDDDGYPCDDIIAISEWVRSSVTKVLANDLYQVLGLNFSTYGASLVNIDAMGEIVTPFYNYLKPLYENISKTFFKKHGPRLDIEISTGSPSNDCLLNSGMQLFWLKAEKPRLFEEIRYSLHFPQFLSYLFTSKVCAEYTSIGCHTALWDYTHNQYHKWIKTEGINHLLPTIEASSKNFL
ncbi:MAG TPA: FGGY family carbohydrate kinase, partial [Saprospiraceae bacterium]|nr:FGGY family carbohydrate kinase [Saprospiraceae bacterium]